jgi:hypothetical protein
VRGKLRDKRATTKGDSIKRELIERRKPGKRDAKIILWLNQEPEDDELELDLLLEDEAEDAPISNKK